MCYFQLQNGSFQDQKLRNQIELLTFTQYSMIRQVMNAAKNDYNTRIEYRLAIHLNNFNLFNIESYRIEI